MIFPQRWNHQGTYFSERTPSLRDLGVLVLEPSVELDTGARVQVSSILPTWGAYWKLASRAWPQGEAGTREIPFSYKHDLLLIMSLSVLWCQEFLFSPCFQRPIFIILVGIKQGPKQLLVHYLTPTNEGKEENSIRPHLLSEKKVYITESRETAGYKAIM